MEPRFATHEGQSIEEWSRAEVHDCWLLLTSD